MTVQNKLQTLYNKEIDAFLSFLPFIMVFGVIAFFRYNIRPDLVSCTILLSAQACLYFSEVKYLKQLGALAFFITLGIFSSQYRLSNIDKKHIKHSIDTACVIGEVEQISTGIDKAKMIMKVLSISNLDPAKTPQKIQFKVAPQYFNELNKINAGYKIQFNASIIPLPRPVYPDAYNFSEIAKFRNIGGLGLVRSDFQIISVPEKNTFETFIERARIYIDRVIASRMKNSDEAGIAMALFTGNTGQIKRETIENIQKAGLSHLLAISGINISIVAITSFFLIRRCLAFSEYLCIQYDVKKLAAVIAMFVSFFHLQISGIPISALRSFIMFTLGLLAIMLDRRPTGVRIISFTLLIVLLAKPEGIFDPSLQMSFMAVLGLIGSMTYITQYINDKFGDGGIILKTLLYFLGITLSSLVSTFATFCYSVYHFNQYSNVGLISNVLAVPISELGMIPLGIVGLFLSIPQIGLDWPFMKLVELLSRAFIAIANYSASLDWSYTLVPQMPITALFWYTISLVILFLFKTKMRFISLFGLAIAVYLHASFPKPLVVIGRNPKDLVFWHQDRYYSKSGFSNQFMQTVWSGRLAQKDIQQASRDITNKYFHDIEGGFRYRSKQITLYVVNQELSRSVISDIQTKPKKQRIFVLQTQNAQHKEELEEATQRKLTIIPKWKISTQGAYIIRNQ